MNIITSIVINRTSIIAIISIFWGFPEIRGTFLGVPIIRIILFWAPYWGCLIWGNYHIHLMRTQPLEHCHLPAVLRSLEAAEESKETGS